MTLRAACLCGIARDEAAEDVREWVCYHLGLGFSHVALYDNGSREPLREVLAPLVARGVVSVTDFTLREAPQLSAYFHALRLWRGRVFWLAFLDIDEFLEGAKLAYTRLQASWDKRDLNDIAQFTTPPVMEALREQLAQEPSSGRTEIILVNAQLLEVNEEGTEERAQVYFDVLLREDPQQSTPTNAREIWHFVRERSNNGMWKLDGIQQISA